ncbi:hypothetical protein L195_g014885 [Trifolium pratense]|uniref:Uncharacterized protein n=1 Tax=Trifolium pratense TaxID=57577 RepID=A0A2K3PS69_TRIPR|nr:hypothetical protein L195_g014885 [Trifolium pratense]
MGRQGLIIRNGGSTIFRINLERRKTFDFFRILILKIRDKQTQELVQQAQDAGSAGSECRHRMQAQQAQNAGTSTHKLIGAQGLSMSMYTVLQNCDEQDEAVLDDFGERR